MKHNSQKFDIRKLRKALNITQADAAGMMGMSTRNWQRVESAPVELPLLVQFIKSACGVFKVPQDPFDLFEIGGSIFSQKDFLA